MSINKYKLLTFLIAFFALSTFIAQIRPVRVSVQLVPPYSGYLPDYADPSAEKLKIVLQFNDFSQAQYDVKLKFEIKGNGFALTSKAFMNVQPITLIPGQPVLLSGSDLAPYLSSNNLDFTGLNQSQYEQRMALPEGNYQICVTAYDYYNSQIAKLSDEVCAQAWFTLSNPPLLNLPVCNSLITPQTPQNLIFQWTPLNLGSPLSALTTEYEFALWECRPDSFVNENQLVLSTAPIYSIVTQQTYLNYSLAEPPLNVYMKYVWRVRAKDISGRDLFINNGKSEICTFFYGQPNNVLGDALNLNVTAQGLSQFSGKCNFNTQSAYTNYQVNMRKVGTNNWFISYTNAGTKSFHNLQGSNVYECRVRGYEPIQGNWSNIATFTTNPPPLAGCNDAAPNIPPNTTPLPLDRAVPGLKVQTTQYVLLVKSIEALPNPGWFKGSGYVNTFGMPLPVEFDAIFIDENSIHQQGTIRAKTTGLDAWLAESDLETASNNATYVGGTLTNVTINGNQYCYTTQQNPTPTCVPIDTTKKITVIRDDAGNQYVINTGPPPTVTGPTSYLNPSTDNLAASDSLKVVFAAATNQSFGFDRREYAAFTNDYELIKLANNSNYFVPNKSIGDNATDRAIANFTISNFVEANLVFKTKSGTVLNKTKAVGLNTYTINGITAGADCIYAWYNNQKIGKLNIISLTKVNKKVVLVPVNGASTAGITQQGLNDIYKQANTTFTLTTAPNFTFDLGNDGLEAADAKLMSKYSTEMRVLRDAYKKKDSLYDKNACYIFIVPSFSDVNLKGYMVRGRALGFVSSAATTTDIAHELGHGAFKLEHTFDAIAKGTSNNLMDYNNQTHLTKSQWLNIQNPTSQLTWWDEEEDGSLGPLDGALAQMITALKLKRNSKGRLVPPPPKPKSTFPNTYDKSKYHFVYLETNEFSEITNYGGYLYLVFYNASNIGAIQVQAPDFVEKSAGKEFLMCRYLADMLPPSIKGKIGLNVVVSDWWQFTHAKFDPLTEKLIVNDTLQAYLDHSNYGVGVSNSELMAASCLEAAQGIAYSLSTLLPMTCKAISSKFNQLKTSANNSNPNGGGVFGQFATYIKNTFKIDQTTLSSAFSTHVNVVDGLVTSSGVSGGHNEIAFKAQCYPQNVNGRVKISSETPHPTVNGVKTITYKVYSANSNGTVDYSKFVQKNGQDKIFYKTTYNPNVISDNEMKGYGYNAFKYAMDNNTFNVTTKSFNGLVNGKNVEGYYETVNGINVIRTWYIKD